MDSRAFQTDGTLFMVSLNAFAVDNHSDAVVTGFEYDPNPTDPGNAWIIWEVDGKPSHRMAAASVGADPVDATNIPNVVDAAGTVSISAILLLAPG